MDQIKATEEQIFNILANLRNGDEILILYRSDLYNVLTSLMKQEGISDETVERILTNLEFIFIDPCIAVV